MRSNSAGLSLAIIFGFLMASVGCSKEGADVQTSGSEWVEISELEKGPIRRDSLSAEQLQRLDSIRSALAEVDGQTREEWIDSFKRDLDPDAELTIWEAIAGAYSRYCSKHNLTLEQKTEVYALLLLRSGTSIDDVLAHVELRVLTESEAREAMEEYSLSPDPTRYGPAK